MEFGGPVLGIDPGSLATGFGIVEQRKSGSFGAVEAGVIRTDAKAPFQTRLKFLHDRISEIIDQFGPSVCAIEDVFVAKNVQSALKLGHARATLIIAALNRGLKVFEYSPLEIKKSVVGYGRADKAQVQKMVALILNLSRPYPQDASDALAVALCHLHACHVNRLVSAGF